MVDVLTPSQRSFNMSRIRGENTKPEMRVRQGLHSRGFRFRLHRADLPGRPDIVFQSRRAVILVHGCFWHGHDCPMFQLPATRAEFWPAKIERNRVRDQAVIKELLAAGWRVLIVWECAFRGPLRQPESSVLGRCERFLRSEVTLAELAGNRLARGKAVVSFQRRRQLEPDPG